MAGVRLADLPFPEGTAVTMIVRGRELVAPRGRTVILPGDHVYIFSRPEERALVRLMFGREES